MVSINIVPMWILTLVCPSLGVLLANIMFFSPLKIVLESRAKNSIENHNPIPWIIIVANCAGWIFYSCLINDLFIFWSNLPGFLLGIFYTITAIELLILRSNDYDTNLVKILEIVLVACAFFWGIIGMIATTVFSMLLFSSRASQLLVGIAACLCTTFYYIAPISTAISVIRTKDSSSLYAPMLLANLTNALLWVGYGSAISNPIVWVPNGVGFVVSLFLLLLAGIFKKKELPTCTTLKLGPDEAITELETNLVI